MPASRKEDKELKVFLDLIVIISAVLSFSGGSFRLIRESIFKNYILLISDYVLEECIRILKSKYPAKLFILTILLNTFRFKIVKDPTQNEVKSLIKIINPEEAPILAGAIKHKAKYLVTLDKKDFLNPEVLRFATKHKILILTPKEFLEKTLF